MALFEDMFKGNVMTGLAVGIGAVILGPTLLPMIGNVVRPAMKAVIKGGMYVYRETLADVGEVASDLFAEARADMEAGGDSGALATAADGGSSRSSGSPRHQGH
jgi:hypothetical protein